MSARVAHGSEARRASAGFTLLEVLVAVAILGLGLTMILSSQVGLFSSASRAEHLTVATNLARCKMTELELELIQDGYPVIDQTDEGRCCADEDEPGYRCRTKVERVELPQPAELPENDGGLLGSPDDPNGGLLGVMSKLGQQQGATPGDPGALKEMAESIGASSMASGMGPMVLGMVYPQLKGLLEASIRKVTVSVLWKEGSREKEFNLTQFVTHPQQPPADVDGGLAGGGLGNALGGMLGGALQGLQGAER
jgi:general secretion pathway protein I